MDQALTGWTLVLARSSRSRDGRVRLGLREELGLQSSRQLALGSLKPAPGGCVVSGAIRTFALLRDDFGHCSVGPADLIHSPGGVLSQLVDNRSKNDL